MPPVHSTTPAVSRREFLKNASLASGLLLLSRDFLHGETFASNRDTLAAASTATADPLFNTFQNPPNSAKPFVRWWWNGDKLSAKEILRELDIMRDAGIGGVEINPIAFPGGNDLGIPSLPWLSPEWLEMVKVALKGASERGIICDIIVGSGWPFGAEFLQGDERSQLLTLDSRKVKGPATLEIQVSELLKNAAPRIHSKYKDAQSELHALYLAPTTLSKFAPPTPVPFDKTKPKLTLQIPAGEHILYGLVKITGFQAVINGAPGAAGPVLNHYNKTAVEKFLNRMSDKFPDLRKAVGPKTFRAMFCDSMELEGANWCSDYAEEFQRRRGYNITPYLPFILYKVGHMGNPIAGTETTKLSGDAKEEIARVRYDFFITCMDIIRDRFLATYTQWCNKHGFQSRVQPYGNEFHPLEASLNIDIPECETWIGLYGLGNKKTNGFVEPDFVSNPAYSNVNKYVASAARLTGKKIVSCEEVTNTNFVFHSTLEQIKITGDQSNLSGVTHSILHGFNYTPLEAPFPGWIRYGTFFNERNPWWPFFKKWAAYKTRLSILLQETEPFADIAVLHPIADLWTIHGPQRDPCPRVHHPRYQYKVWEGIHKNGNTCDYTSESIIQKSTAENGWLKYNKRKYHTLLLLEVETMQPETAKALTNFVAQGGKLIFVGKEPNKSPGLVNYKQNDAKVASTIAALKATHPARVFTVKPPSGDTVSWFAEIQRECGIKPPMRIENPSNNVSQIHHRADGKDIYFISNASQSDRVVLTAAFPDSKGTPFFWNAETGERLRYPVNANGTLTIDLPPSVSQLIVFEDKKELALLPVSDSPLLSPPSGAGLELKNWTLRMEHVNGEKQKRKVAELFDLATDSLTRSFAGTLYYEKKLSSDFSTFQWLDLGKVHGVSEVSLDGEQLGCRWHGKHLYRLPGKVAGKTLQIKVTTTLGNYFKSTPENKVGHRWSGRQGWTSIGLLGPVELFNADKKQPDKTGLVAATAASPRIVNIVNFIRQLEPRGKSVTEQVLYDTVAEQVRQLKQYSLPGTFLLQYDALINPKYQALLKNELLPGSEVGAWWEITQPHVVEAGIKWRGRFPWDWHADVGFATGYSPVEREKLVDVYVEKFKSIFGKYPASVGSWFIDAHTLAYFHDKYGIVASCNCKDQVGTDGYTLWGGYWNQAYYPSRKNAYMPAQNAAAQIPVPIFRMLGSDPIYQYDSGLGGQHQSVISLEPVYRHAGGDKNWVDWFFKNLTEEPCLAFNYVQAGQENSFTWASMKNGLNLQIPIIAELAKRGKVRVETLENSGRWFKEKYPLTPPTAVTALSDYKNKGSKTVWFNSRFYRTNLLWEGRSFRFRDIHLFDETVESSYLKKAGTSRQCIYKTLPFVDGFHWSKLDLRAGLRIVDENGVVLSTGVPQVVEISGKTGKVASGKDVGDVLRVSFSTVLGAFEIIFHEDRIEISSEKKSGWSLELKTAAGVALPFSEISERKIAAVFEKHVYSIGVPQGVVGKAPDSVFRIKPESGRIVLDCAKR